MIKINNISLNKLTQDDIKPLYQYVNTDFVQKYNMLSITTYEEFAQSMLNRKGTDYVIKLKNTNEVIGNISVDEDHIRYNVNAITISYWLAEKFANKGYMSEALEIIIQQLFNEGYDMITARVFSENIGSIKLLEKLGFEKEGYLKKAVRNNHGKVFDDVLFVKFK
ncbi:MAG: GNAT family protein [Erysipelotrichaceae bacterium]|nr:GNAT family protein [Erysipelotrichaceae bacterium]